MTVKEVHDKYPHLTLRQVLILDLVDDGLVYTTRIATHLDMFASVISRNVHSLKDSGLLTRTEERDDKNCQKWLLKLTTQGQKVLSCVN